MTDGLLHMHLSACLVCDGGDTPVRILLVPDGEVESVQGDMIVDKESGRLVKEAFAEHGTDLVIDFEHQTLGGKYASPSGQAPAAGWIKAIHYEPGTGIVGEVEWTDQARKMIRAKQYRYLSPVAIVRKTDRKLIGLHSAALTNTPAIRHMEAVAAKHLIEEAGSMEGSNTNTQVNQQGGEGPDSAEQLLGQISQILKGKGVEVGTSAESILSAVIAALEGGDAPAEGADAATTEEASSVRKALGLESDAETAIVLKQLSAVAAHVGYTPNEKVTALTARIDELEIEHRKRRGAELREAYKTKFNPRDEATTKWANEMSEKDPDFFEMYAKSLPTLAMPPQGRTGDPGPGGTREAIIASARAEYDEDPDAAICTRVAFICGELADRDLGPLTDQEKAALN